MPTTSTTCLGTSDTDLADLAGREDVVGVVARLGREIERDRHPPLTLSTAKLSPACTSRWSDERSIRTDGDESREPPAVHRSPCQRSRWGGRRQLLRRGISASSVLPSPTAVT